ncbi:MAG: YgfZ/GcvT domain-containing protein, partial [Nitrospinales bacterium]
MGTASHITSEFRQVREHCGWFFLPDWTLIFGQGRDIFSFLQTQTTNDVQQLAVGGGQDSAIANRKGKLTASFSIHRDSENSLFFLVQKNESEKLLKRLESYLFREDVRLSHAPQNALLAVQGPKSDLLARRLAPDSTFPQKPNEIARFHWENEEILIIRKSLTGEEGVVIAFRDLLKEKIVSFLENEGSRYGLTSVSPETQEVLRIEAGIPLFGKDMDESRILPETGLAHTSVSYNKGCYVGQEVIARIKTYGAPAHALMGLIFESGDLPPYDGEIRLGSKKIGTVKSSVFSRSLGKNIALAYLQKDYRIPGKVLDIAIEGVPFKA